MSKKDAFQVQLVAQSGRTEIASGDLYADNFRFGAGNLSGDTEPRVVVVPQPDRPPSPAKPSAPATAAAPAMQPVADRSRIDVLKEQAPNAIEWALAPLDQAVPGDIRQNLTFLREDVLDEAQLKPKTARESYALGSQICNALLAIFEERNQTLVRAGFRAVEANTRTGVSSQALEARRNYMMSWTQYSREESQRAELKSQAVNNAAVIAERPKMEWVGRTTAYRKNLDSLYARFRASLRQESSAK
jgi:hypothetical protein